MAPVSYYKFFTFSLLAWKNQIYYIILYVSLIKEERKQENFLKKRIIETTLNKYRLVS